MREVRRTHDGREAFRFVVSYILIVHDAKHREALTAVLEREIGPEAKDIIMTIGEQFIEQGIQQGIQQGERGLLLRLLRKRFGAQVNADTEHRIEAASPEQIALWAERVLSAATLAELLAD